MKKSNVLFILLIPVLILIYFFIDNSVTEGELKFGTYRSRNLIVRGTSSTFHETNPEGKQTGMEYVIDENQIMIRHVDTDKFSILPKSMNGEYAYSNIRYVEKHASDIPEHRFTFLSYFFEDLDSGIIVIIFDEDNNMLQYEFLLLNGDIYIIDRYKLLIDKIFIEE